MSTFKCFSVLFFLLSASSSYALSFRAGEKLTYSMQWTIFTAGYLTSTVQNPTHDPSGNVIYPIVAVAKSTKAVNAIYPLNETLTSAFDQNFFSRSFELHGREGDETKDIVQTHDYSSRQITLYKRIGDISKKKSPKVDNKSFPLSHGTQDVLSSLYYLRTIDLPQPGQQLTFPVAWEGETYTAVVQFIETDKIRFNKQKVTANVYRFDLYKDGKIDIGGTKVWISPEGDRLILKIDAKLSFGTIHIKLESVE